MKKHHKLGNQPGKPAYRTPSRKLIARITSHLCRPPRLKPQAHKTREDKK